MGSGSKQHLNLSRWPTRGDALPGHVHVQVSAALAVLFHGRAAARKRVLVDLRAGGHWRGRLSTGRGGQGAVGQAKSREGCSEPGFVELCGCIRPCTSSMD
eukprot:365124-Chlamydomonas_euryale.AAC.18